MKVAIYGQYYQNSTEPIIRDIFVFFNENNVEMIIEAEFLKILYEKTYVTLVHIANDFFMRLYQAIHEHVGSPPSCGSAESGK